MLAIFVYVHVKPDVVEAFKKATIENASHSINEPGVTRFDFFQQNDDPSKFTLVEVYKTAQAAADHKETDHYKKWRDTAAEMMAEPRYSVKHTNLFPIDEKF